MFAENLALNATPSASNTRGDDPQFAATNLFDGSHESYWATDDGETTPELALAFSAPTEFSIVELREYLPLGQRVNRFAVDIEHEGSWKPWCEAESIGSRRLIRGEVATASLVRLRILDSAVCPALSAFGLY